MPDASKYQKEIASTYAQGLATEHSYRPALKSFIESFNSNIEATNEPKRSKVGAPDFIVSKSNTPIGYIEAKDIDTNLNEIIKSEQLIRYREGLTNLILTNYLEFIWFRNGKDVMRESLGILDGKKIKPNDSEKVNQLIKDFLSTELPTVDNPKQLAKLMADKTQIIREVIRNSVLDEHDKGTLHEQMEAFREVLLRDLKEQEFADMYAQTIAYGLFAAKCHQDPSKPFTRENAGYMLPKTNPFLRNIFNYIAGPQLDEKVVWIVEDLVNLLNHTDMSSILKDFGKRTKKEDPVVHFYEDFLAEYDPKMREARGVYYTPESVVSYIVRSVDLILQKEFDIKEGLADKQKINWKLDDKPEITTHRLHILDPAVGTGTFLYFVFQEIYEKLAKNRGLWSGYVKDDLLPRVHGFELLMAPYSVAHMKLGIQLKETGYKFETDDRLSVYLTNSLEEGFIGKTRSAFDRWLLEEANSASRVKKDYPVMVVLGNPPYSGHSANKSKDEKGNLNLIGKLMQDYYLLNGKRIEEKNPKWLQDDYVKFIRFAQWRIERTGRGILAFITNHGYLDNPTFRGMRQQLLKTFDEIYILDLHGNAKKKEKTPSGGIDQNVFDIQQGVAIGIFTKKTDSKEYAKVFHADAWGLREEKNNFLEAHDIANTDWQEIKPVAPFYLFKPFDHSLSKGYHEFWKITDIFPLNSVGIVTARDHLTIQFTPEDVWKVVSDFASLPVEDARGKYKLGPDARDWKVEFAQKDLNRPKPIKNNIVPILYRPFDIRFTYFTGNSRGFHCMPRGEVMRNMILGENIALLTSRLTKGETFAHTQISENIVEVISMSPKTSNNSFVFPLYIYPSGTLKIETERKPNISEEFLKELKKIIGDDFTPEEILYYAYAVFHSPSYRETYREFLAIDFPRLPMPKDKKQFKSLASLGERLANLHLMKTTGKNLPNYPISGDNRVEIPRFVVSPSRRTSGRIYINKTQYFEPVSEEVWNFHIGGYQVCLKWLKDRKHRTLTNLELQHYRQIVANLEETIEVMKKIDETFK
jgi:predicted helicase